MLDELNHELDTPGKELSIVGRLLCAVSEDVIKCTPVKKSR